MDNHNVSVLTESKIYNIISEGVSYTVTKQYDYNLDIICLNAYDNEGIEVSKNMETRLLTMCQEYENEKVTKQEFKNMLAELVRAYDLKMGSSALKLRIKIAKNALKLR